MDDAQVVACLSLPIAIASVPRAHAEIARALAPHDPSPRVQQAVDVVVEEMLMNLLMHAFDDPTEQTVELEVALTPQRVRLRFRDRGRPFDPLAVAPAPLPRTLAEAGVGGLGLRLVRNAAAHIAYRRDDGCNELTVEVDRG